MTIATGLLDVLRRDLHKKNIQPLSDGETLVSGLSGTQKSIFAASVFTDDRLTSTGPRIIVTHSRRKADQWHRDLTTLLGAENVVLFTDLETLPHEEVIVDIDAARDRMRVLERLANDESVVAIVQIQAMMQKIVPPHWFRSCRIQVAAGDQIDMEDMARRLVDMGYERLDRVESPGQFAVRGGIIDVFPLTAERPLRLDLFDDIVDAIRLFDPVSQRSEESLSSVSWGPATQWLIDPKRREEALHDIASAAQKQADALRRAEEHEAAESLTQRIADHMEKIQAGQLFEGMGQYMGFFHDDMATLLDYVGDGLIILDEPVRLQEQYRGFLKDRTETHAVLIEKGRILPTQIELVADWSQLFVNDAPKVYIQGLDQRIDGMKPDRTMHIEARAPQVFHGRIERLAGSLRQWSERQFKVCVMVSTPERGERVVEAFRDEGLDVVQVTPLNGQLQSGNIVVTTGALHAGVEFPESRLLVLTDLELFGRPKRVRRRRRKDDRGTPLVDFSDLKEGDYVVHTNHGIGRYVGVETLEIQGAHKDYLVVQYAGEDKLYVPTDQVDLLQRYYGMESQTPKLSRLGGNEWARVKKRVKQSVQEMAEGLLNLYAERETIQGHAFAPDTVWQAEFEDAFPYEETHDQMRAIEEVKRDMARPQPMDRLLCGDVGYGKTEVAVRAAFKAVMEGKQVALLVPTTILAQQHGRTFEERFDGYPVQVRVLSRFQTAGEQSAILKGVQKGSVDIVIGTHRLLSKDVVFKDLGLVVVDEEQRFGVSQKERLKELCKNVDVLTLSATPIPRTLHMSLAGVRDMSVIETPPEDRLPVRTYVVEYDDDLMREAIMRELGRGGQVYFVYNQVQRIDVFAASLRRLVPEARIAVAHGQMEEDRLERVMLDFLDGEYDLLLCSTIIETGMDIANVNTLIVHDADRLGLAQLYQLRGRVGRSHRIAYAYFTYQRDKVLAEDAEKRLQAIKEFTELGSGFKIAMRDLEIRGAGNLLGAEQHGFIASIGFELYCRLLDESIKELRGEAMVKPPEPVIDLSIDAYIADEYITDSRQKVEMYKKVVAVHSLEDGAELEEEMLDRFGELPQSVKNLLAVSRIKVLARQAGVSSIASQRDGAVIKLHAGMQLPKEALDLTRKYRGRVVAPPRAGHLNIRGKGLTAADLLALIEMVATDLAHM